MDAHTTEEKTVFISYRRSASSFVARAIFMDLHMHGYDVFMDVENIDSGTFDTKILNQIEARAHFLVILSPGTLDRVNQPGDWLRREIEHAIQVRRNVVPILVGDFRFEEYKHLLTGTLAELPRYNGPTLYHEYFDAAMDRLRTRFLKQPVEGDIVPASPDEQAEAAAKIEHVANQPVPTEDQLEAEKHFNEGYQLAEDQHFDAALEEYNEAIRLNPSFPEAYNNRGVIYMNYEDYQAAIDDFTRSIELENTQLYLPYSNRADALILTQQYDRALADCDQAIELNPEFPSAYQNRGRVHFYTGQLELAQQDFSRVIELDPELATAYVGRGAVRAGLGDLHGAIEDFGQAMELDTNELDAHNNRGEAYFALGEYAQAAADYAQGNTVRPGNIQSLAGLALSHHAQGNTREARRLWRTLISMDEGFRDADWTCKYLNWPEVMGEEARALIAGL